MMHKRQRYVPTGHRDCCGDMVRRGDTVATRDGEARVIWACGRWWLYFAEGPKRPLNGYPARGLRRCDNAVTIACDNARDNKNAVCDNTRLSQKLSQSLSQVQPIVAQKVGYICDNVTIKSLKF